MPIYSTTPISQLTPIVTLNALDVLPIVDVSDTTQSLAGSTKKVTYQQLLSQSGQGVIWNNATMSQNMTAGNGYLANSASLVSLTLPTIANQLTLIEVGGYGIGGWKILQNMSQQIDFGTASTTMGIGGSLSSSNQYDCIRLLCTVANTKWVVLSVQGNVTYV
jgi:hypothetical protein